MPLRTVIALLLAILALATPAHARVEKISVHGPSLVGNLEGNSPDRTVMVALPPSYDKSPRRRYPVIYFLHGLTAKGESTFKDFKMEAGMDAFIKATGKEFILVAPDTYTRHGGSFYTNSVTAGNFEDFTARDLVGVIDKKYRTMARRESRGLMGHSMGGYGTFRLGMKHPETFSALYALNPCCIGPMPIHGEGARGFETMDLETALKGDFRVKAYFATAAAWSPNPNTAPFYIDFGTRNGEVDPLVLAKWNANSIQAMLPQYLTALRRMKGIALDTGDKDFVRGGAEAMHAEFDKFHMPHDWELYEGDHGNRVAERLPKIVFPFFARHLAFESR